MARSSRWTAVSASANIDADYKLATRNPVAAYAFVCLCRPPFDGSGASDRVTAAGSSSSSTTTTSTTAAPARCDDGETCMCNRPAAEHPGYRWRLSAAGKRKLFAQRVHFQLRCPGNFGMRTFDDHEHFGVVEILQNLVLDFEEAANYKEQWAVCEALAFFLRTRVARNMAVYVSPSLRPQPSYDGC